MKTLYGVLGLPLVLSGCTDVIAVESDLTGDILVRTTASVYRWSDVEEGAGLTIEATLTNQGVQPYYARLGDAFLADEEQPVLFVATGSDAFFEREIGSTWVEATRITMIEGVKTVVLQPGSSYTLMSYVTGERITGTFRLRVVYKASADSEAIVGESFSISFELQ